MESGCCESQLPKNSLNLYAIAREGEGCAETQFWMWSIGGDAKESTWLWNLKLVYWVCDQAFEGIWAQKEGLEGVGRRKSSRMCTVTAVWIKSLCKAQPKGYSRGQSSFGSRGSRAQLISFVSVILIHSNQRRQHYKPYHPAETAVILHQTVHFNRANSPLLSLTRW